MEGIGAEVWQKIRSAIKAKLMELGAYVDEELPEYIMVMVGNKRSRTQMEEDLKLFLGSNSVHFTNWLHQVLQKLQEVTVPNLNIIKPSSSSIKRKSTDESSKKKKKSKSSDSSEKKLDKKIKDENDIETKLSDEASKKNCDNSSDQENSEYQRVKFSPEKEEEVNLEEIQSKKSEESETTVEKKIDDTEIVETLNQEETSIICDGEEDDFLNIKADIEGEDLMEGDTDTFEESAPKESPTTKQQDLSDSESDKSVPKYIPTLPAKHNDKKFDARLLLNRKTDARELLNRKAAARLAVHDNKRSVDKNSKRDRERERSPSHRHYDSDRSYNDRHSSRRIIVSSKDLPRKYDDDKDKHSNRSQSSSRGTKRKANSDVHDSNSNREKFGDRLKRELESSSIETVKKKCISISQSPKEDGYSRIRNSETEENRKRSAVLSRVVPRRHDPEENVETPVPSVIKVTPRPRRPLSQQANHTLILRAMADANKSMASVHPRPDVQQQNCSRVEGVFTRTLREKNRIPADKIAVSFTNSRVSTQGNCSKSKDDFVEDQQDEVNNETKLEESGKEKEIDKIAFEDNTLLSETEADIEPTDAIGEWLKDVDEARSSDNITNQPNNVENNASFSKAEDEPQFVVTLNGLDPGLFFKNDDDEEFDEWEKPREILDTEAQKIDSGNASAVEMQDLRKKVPISTIGLLKNTANSNNLVDVMEATKAKPVERCKYWPNCRTGDQCVYHHPVTPCKSFPTCKFGDHCLFIHPHCKFNAACTRRGCPYSHTTSMLPIQPTVMKAVQACRFFPKCTNMSCPFFHPKICKFGSYCTKKDCTFSHLEIASVNKLKWSREGTS